MMATSRGQVRFRSMAIGKLWFIALICCLGLLLVSVRAWAGHDPDLNNGGVVNILDISRVGSCFGLDPATNPQYGPDPRG